MRWACWSPASREPGDNLVGALLLAQGGLIALSLILIDEIDNAYGDVYSGSVSAHSLQAALEHSPLGPAARACCALRWPWCCRCTAWSRSC